MAEACWGRLTPCFSGLLSRTRSRERQSRTHGGGDAATDEPQVPPPKPVEPPRPTPELEAVEEAGEVATKSGPCDESPPKLGDAEPPLDVGVGLAVVPAMGAGLARPQPPPAPLDSEGDDSNGDVDGWAPPLAEPGPDGLPSKGSAGHDRGECRRCCFFPKGRCTNGYECMFCHLDHDRRKRLKKKRSRTGAELMTPSSTTGSVGTCLLSTSLTPSGASIGWSAAPISAPYPLLSPGHGVLPSTPMTPSMQPPTPPPLSTLPLLEETIPPPPPEAPRLPAGFEEKLEQMSRQASSEEHASSSMSSAQPDRLAAPPVPPPLMALEGAACFHL